MLLLQQTSHIQACRTVSTIKQRKQCLLRLGRCFICLKRGHIEKHCHSSQNCLNCRGQHHVSICPSPSSKDVSSSTNTSSPQQTAQSASTNVKSASLHATVSMHVSTHTSSDPHLRSWQTTIFLQYQTPI